MCYTDNLSYYTGLGKVELTKNLEEVDEKVLKALEKQKASQLDVFYIRKKVNEIHGLTNEVLAALKDHLAEEAAFQSKILDLMTMEVGNGKKQKYNLKDIVKLNYETISTIRDIIVITERIKKHKILLFVLGITIFMFNDQIGRAFGSLLKFVNIETVFSMFN